ERDTLQDRESEHSHLLLLVIFHLKISCFIFVVTIYFVSAYISIKLSCGFCCIHHN
ncbi:unnamed protein product, partial [Brassica rapa subsp. trilocularis]